METDLITAGSQRKFKVSSLSSQSERDAIEEFLLGNSYLDDFLNSLGFRVTLLRGDARKIGPLTRRRSADNLRSHHAHKFPAPIKERLLSFNCGQLLAVLPESSGVAESEKVTELLFDEFSDDPVELGKRIYKYTQYRKKPYEVFEKIVDLYKDKYRDDLKTKSKATSDFFLSYFKQSKMAEKQIATIMICSLEHDDIVDLSNTLLTTIESPHHEEKRFLDTLDAETFTLIAQRTVMEDFKRHSKGDIFAHTPYEEVWDEWLAKRMQRLIDEEQPHVPNGTGQVKLFNWDQFKKARDVFSPLSFPQTSAVLVHIGMQHYPTHIQDRVLAALESLDQNPEYAPIAKKFVEVILDDTNVFRSQGGRHLLGAIENVFEDKFPQNESKFVVNQSLIYEIKLVAAIANANNLQLQDRTEILLSSDEPSCVMYIRGGAPTNAFLDDAVKNGKIDTVITILEEDLSANPNVDLSKEQLEILEERFLELLNEAIQTGMSNAPNEVATINFRRAARLNELHPLLTSALKHQTILASNNDFDPSRNIGFG